MKDLCGGLFAPKEYRWYSTAMLKRRIEAVISKFAEADAYDPRQDPKGTGWYFPGSGIQLQTFQYPKTRVHTPIQIRWLS